MISDSDSAHLKSVEAAWPGNRFSYAIEVDNDGILNVGRLDDTELLTQSISRDGGLTWPAPAPLREQGAKADAPPIKGLKSILVRLKSGALGMTYGNAEGVFFRKSFDEGETWTTPMGPPQYRWDPEDPTTGAGSAQARPIVMPSGRVIKPRSRAIAHTYFDPNQGESGERRPLVDTPMGYFKGRLVGLEGHTHEVSLDLAFVSYTDDEGETWRRNEDGILFTCMDHGAGPIGSMDEVTTVALRDASVVLFGRTELGQLFKSVSTDEGVTWSQPEPTGLAAACAPADAVRMPDSDHVLLVWTQTSADEIRRGLWRARLSSAISSDSCLTWKHFRCIEAHGVPPYPRVPAPEPRWVRADPFVPHIPDDFAHSSYPRIVMLKDYVVLTYCHYPFGFGPLPETAGFAGQPGVRVFPHEWFYDAD